MRDPETPYGFPEMPYPKPPFPTEIPWDTPIAELSNWWLEIACDCSRTSKSQYPLRLMAANVGWGVSLRAAVDRLKCKKCGGRPGSVVMVDDAAGDVGRFGAVSKKMRLR